MNEKGWGHHKSHNSGVLQQYAFIAYDGKTPLKLKKSSDVGAVFFAELRKSIIRNVHDALICFSGG